VPRGKAAGDGATPAHLAANGDVAIALLLEALWRGPAPWVGFVRADHGAGIELLRRRAVLLCGFHETNALPNPVFVEAGDTQMRMLDELARGPLPTDACARFGPDPPPGDVRPRDPDPTGGFFQPVLVRAFDEIWAHPQRVACGLPWAPADVARAFAERYRPNRNPAPPTLEAEAGGSMFPLDALPRQAGRITLRARWSSEDAETYLWWDPSLRGLREHRESIRLSWYVSAGRLDAVVTSREEGDLAAESVNAWPPPKGPGPQTIWLVLSDARGGAGVAEVRIRVELERPRRSP
jgi:hypothetical protein